MVRVLLLLAALSALFADTAHAQQNGFDLDGPEVAVSVTRGAIELPVAAVPSLRGGDKLTARALLPADQSARYLLVVAFLRGATNPPPKNWFFSVETWKARRNVLTVTVPQGAEQAILFLAPEAGGGFSAVRGAVRGRPGVFVRAAQDLYQASLDRQRLDAFVGAVGRIGDAAPERLATAAPVLAEALRIKLNADCLLKQRALQAACLTQQRDALVLQAQRGATLTETLTGAPVDLAYRVAATREGGAGYYSPYIALARDLARLFGAFRSAQYQYLPALALGKGDAIHLQLNSAPSFQNPRSVLVAPLPPIGDAPPPLWRSSAPGALCLAKPDLVLPIDDAALLFATDYARDLALKVTVAEVQRSLAKQLGINLSGSFSVGSLSGGFNTPMATNANIPAVGGNATFPLGASSINVELRALEARGGIRTLAEPVLTALSGKPATFLAGGELPYQTLDGNGRAVTEFKPYGVQLSFTPTIKSDGTIQLEVKTTVSEPNGQALNTRDVETTVQLGVGQTLSIGGMLSERSRQQIDRLPGLGDIPILGALFRSREYTSDRTELVFLVTPYYARAQAHMPELPTDNIQFAGDAEAMFLGHIETIYGVGPDGMRGSYDGSIGFLLD